MEQARTDSKTASAPDNASKITPDDLENPKTVDVPDIGRRSSGTIDDAVQLSQLLQTAEAEKIARGSVTGALGQQAVQMAKLFLPAVFFGSMPQWAPIDAEVTEGVVAGNMSYFLFYNGAVSCCFFMLFLARNRYIWGFSAPTQDEKGNPLNPGWIQRFTGGASTGTFFKYLFLQYVTSCSGFLLVSLAFGPELLKTSYIVLYMAPVVTGGIDFFVMKIQEPMMNAMTYKNSEVGKVAEPGKLIFVLNGIYGPAIWVGFALIGIVVALRYGTREVGGYFAYLEFVAPVLATVMVLNLKASAAKQLSDEKAVGKIPTEVRRRAVQQCNGYLDCQMGTTLLMTFIPGPLNPIAIVVFALIRCYQRRRGLLQLLNAKNQEEAKLSFDSDDSGHLVGGGRMKEVTETRYWLQTFNLFSPIVMFLVILQIRKLGNVKHFYVYRCTTDDDVTNQLLTYCCFVGVEAMLWLAESLFWIRGGAGKLAEKLSNPRALYFFLHNTGMKYLKGQAETHITTWALSVTLFSSCFFITYDGLMVIKEMEPLDCVRPGANPP